MLVLAEIADKMPTAVGMWFVMSVVTFFLFVFSIWRWWTCLVGLVIATLISSVGVWMFYGLAYIEDDRKEIWRELGGRWVAHSIFSSLLPFMLMSAVTLVGFRVWPTIGSHHWGHGGQSRRAMQQKNIVA